VEVYHVWKENAVSTYRTEDLKMDAACSSETLVYLYQNIIILLANVTLQKTAIFDWKSTLELETTVYYEQIMNTNFENVTVICTF
jgi:hypothetical protein